MDRQQLTIMANKFQSVLSVHKMRLGSKWHENTCSGCKGSPIHGRNLGTSGQWSDVLSRQEDPHGRTRR